jgi:hypothetical protein
MLFWLKVCESNFDESKGATTGVKAVNGRAKFLIEIPARMTGRREGRTWNIEHPTSNAEHPMRGDARSANPFEKPNIVARRFLKLLFPPGNGVAEAFSRKIDEMAQMPGILSFF